VEKSTIGWTNSSWNAISGCDEVSPGCDRCYAREIAERFRGGPAYPNGFELTLKPEKLLEPLKWREGRRIFVNSMSDLFHRKVARDYLDKMFAVMAVAEQHTFQVLTKRPERMLAYCDPGEEEFEEQWERRLKWLQDLRGERVMNPYWDRVRDLAEMEPGAPRFLDNVWLGVSVEDQRRTPRIDTLRRTPAAVRFVSFEPLLGPIEADLTGISWAIIGGESGQGARKMERAWVESLISQCRRDGVAVFVKQLGSVWASKKQPRPMKDTPQGRKFDSKGENPENWPEHLRIQEYPKT